MYRKKKATPPVEAFALFLVLSRIEAIMLQKAKPDIKVSKWQIIDQIFSAYRRLPTSGSYDDPCCQA